MVLPAIIGPILSALAWLGVDIAIDRYLPDDSVTYVTGLDFPNFIATHWPTVLLYASIVMMGIWLAFPKRSEHGPGAGRF